MITLKGKSKERTCKLKDRGRIQQKMCVILLRFHVINIDSGFSQFDQNVDNFSKFETHRPLLKNVENH
jgi:hypothetical protein